MNVTKEEILSKCTPQEIAEGNYHIIAAKVSVGRVRAEKILIEDVQAYLQSEGIWWTIKGTAADPAHPAKLAAEAILDVANARYTHLDMTLPIVGQMFGALLATGVLTKVQYDHLTTMGVVPDPAPWEQCQSAILGA